MKVVKERDGNFPWKYLDKKIEDILKPLDLTVEEFIKICDEFTNKKLFLTDKDGKLIKDKNGNLKKINYDNVDVGDSKQMEVAIIDYGMGNLLSVVRAFQKCGADTAIIDNPLDLAM